jgi:GNAT superfamily N-acetyltransferase
MGLPGALAFERAGLRAWPGIEVEWDGQWVRRAAGGYTQRANSLQSLSPADDADSAARLAASRAWFAARGLPIIVRTTPLAGPGLVAELDAQGWANIDASCLFAMALDPHQPDPRADIHALLDPAFLRAQQALQAYSDEKRNRMAALLAVIDVPAAGIVVRSADGTPVASGLMAVADGIVITGNVVTRPDHRRQGYAAAMMRTGLAWAHSAGATIAALNVSADNHAAQTLYRGMGYAHQYDYSYRIPGAA